MGRRESALRRIWNAVTRESGGRLQVRDPRRVWVAALELVADLLDKHGRYAGGTVSRVTVASRGRWAGGCIGCDGQEHDGWVMTENGGPVCGACVCMASPALILVEGPPDVRLVMPFRDARLAAPMPEGDDADKT